MKKKILLYVSVATYCSAVWAQTPIAVSMQPEARFEIAQPEKNQPIVASEPASVPSENVRHIRSQDLLHEPELLKRALDSAMFARDHEAVRLLLPLYLQLNQKDEILARYAQARLAQVDGNIDEAVALYEQILQEQNHAGPVRLDLTQALLHDHRQKEAQQQLDILVQTEQLPEEVSQLLQHYQSYLQQQRQWQFSGSLNYLYENNINNAPSQTVLETETGTWQFSPPEKARGISYEFSADKRIPLQTHWSLLVGSQIYGKYYPNKSDYNDVNIGAHFGVSHRNAHREWRVLPVYEKRWFGGEPYSELYGVRVQHNRVLTPNWHSFTNIRAAYNRHNQRNFLDGSSFSVSQTFQYRVNPSNILLFGADFLRENARDDSSASSRKAARLSWINYWKGLETSVHLTASERHYDAPDWFLNERRKDRQLSSYMTLAHNKIQWNGFMPKLAWLVSKQKSNHLLYRYNKQQFFVEVGRTF